MPVVTQSAPPSAVFPWQPEAPPPPGWIVREREEWAESEPPAEWSYHCLPPDLGVGGGFGGRGLERSRDGCASRGHRSRWEVRGHTR